MAKRSPSDNPEEERPAEPSTESLCGVGSAKEHAEVEEQKDEAESQDLANSVASRTTALATLETDVVTAFSAGTTTHYTEPWLVRVRDVDDDTMEPLLRTLVNLRRIQRGVTGLGLISGAFFFGIPAIDSSLVSVLVYGTLAATFALPIHAVGSLTVRRFFLKEARRHGLSRSASLLLLTRAERRARHLRPLLRTDDVVERLTDAVRDPDRAD